MSPIVTDDNAICHTPACMDAASQILDGLRPNWNEPREFRDACYNFAEFACGGFESHNLFPTVHDSKTLLGRTWNGNSLILRDILEGEYPSGTDSDWITIRLSEAAKNIDRMNFEKMQGAYNICMDTKQIEATGLDDLRTLVSQIVDFLPIDLSAPADFSSIESATVNKLETSDWSSMADTEAFLERMGIKWFLSLSVWPKKRDMHQTELVIAPNWSTELLNGMKWATPEGEAAYLSMVADLLVAVYPSPIENARALEMVKGVRDLGRMMVEKSDEPYSFDPHPSPFGRKLYNIIDQHTHKIEDKPYYMEYTKLKWNHISYFVPESLNISSVIRARAPNYYDLSDWVMILDCRWFAKLYHILNRTPKDVIQTYFILQTVFSMKDYVIDDLVDQINRQITVNNLEDPDYQEPRWKTCVSHVDRGASWLNMNQDNGFAWNQINGLTWILGRFYIGRAFSQDFRGSVAKFFDQIEQTFILRVTWKYWMPSRWIRNKVIAQVRAIANVIGWPDTATRYSPNLFDPASQQNHYDNLPATKSYLMNAVAAAQHHQDRMWNSLGGPADTSWAVSPSRPDIPYYTKENTLVVSAGILQPPMFDTGYPAWMNYGGLGVIAGHEITQGITHLGRRYSVRKNAKNTGRWANDWSSESKRTWWDHETWSEFLRRAECFAHQYGNMSVSGPEGKMSVPSGDGKNLNMSMTLAENIADVGGLLLAHAAWKRTVIREEQEARGGQIRDGLAAAPIGQKLPGLEELTDEQLFFVRAAQAFYGYETSGWSAWMDGKGDHTPWAARINGMMANSRAFKEAFGCVITKPKCKLW